MIIDSSLWSCWSLYSFLYLVWASQGSRPWETISSAPMGSYRWWYSLRKFLSPPVEIFCVVEFFSYNFHGKLSCSNQLGLLCHKLGKHVIWRLMAMCATILVARSLLSMSSSAAPLWPIMAIRFWIESLKDSSSLQFCSHQRACPIPLLPNDGHHPQTQTGAAQGDREE